MALARQAHVATLLPSGKVLVAGGYSVANSTFIASAEVYDPRLGTWASAGSMASAREFPTATLLLSGKVLVAGGSYLSSAEVYDPRLGTWAFTGSMTSPRVVHTATLLPSGKVLVAGGNGNSSVTLTSAEVYDPATGTWSSTGSMASGRRLFTATLLPSGKVLVAGGNSNSGYLSSAEVYDPTTGTWTSAGSMTAARSNHTATLLPSGKVLVVGGNSNSGVLSSAEVYDPATGTWTPAESMTSARSSHTAMLLPSGIVLVTGGYNIAHLTSAELYDPATGTWSSTGSMALGRRFFTGTLLPSGKVLVAGGYDLTSAEVYEDTGALDAWRPTIQPLAILRPGTTVTVTGDGFHGVSEASNGNAQSSATNFPLFNLTAVEGGAATRVIGSDFSDTSVTTAVPPVPDGYYILTVITNAISSGQMVLLDGPPPVPVVLTPANRAVVNTLTPLITGTAEAGSTVTISLDGTVAGTAVAHASARWSFTPSTALAQGLHSVMAQASDAAGNTSPASGLHSFTVDTIAPLAPVVLTPADGTVVNTTRPLISGTAEAGSTVTISLDGTVAGTTVADASENWSFIPSTTLALGLHSVTTYASDAAGNIGPTSSPCSFTVDAKPPPEPVLLAPANGSVVNTMRPLISGTAMANSTVRIFLDDTVAGLALADALGSWSFTPSAALAQGPHRVSAKAIDTAGNPSHISSPSTFVVDTVAPAIPVVTSPAAGTVVITKNLTVTGTAEVGTTVTVILDGAEVGTEAVTGTGVWSFMPAGALPLGTHTLAAKGIDAAGNASQPSVSTSFTIATRSHYGGCTNAPTSPAGWVAVTLGIGWLRRRKCRQRVQLLRAPKQLTLVLLCFISLVSDEAFGGAPTARTSYPGRRSPHFKDVARSYDNLRYEKALKALQTARATSGNSPEELLWLDLMEGVLQYELENEEAAAEAFTRALAWSREAQLPVPNPSPKLLEFFEGVRKHTPGTPPAAVTPLVFPQSEAAPPLAELGPPTAVEKETGMLVGTQPKPPVPSVQPEPVQESSALDFMLGLRSEAELLKGGISPSLTAELSEGSNARLPEVRLGAALTALFLPMGVRAESRLYAYDLGPAGRWRVRPYLALGATYVLASGGVGGRGSLGATLQFKHFQLFADVAYERFFTSDDTYYYEPHAVHVSLGAGWRPFARR
jgi:hypothetical protein